MKGRGAVTGNVAHMASPRTGAGAYAGVRDEEDGSVMTSAFREKFG